MGTEFEYNDITFSIQSPDKWYHKVYNKLLNIMCIKRKEWHKWLEIGDINNITEVTVNES